MDCARCKHSEELKDGVYSMKDGITYYVAGECNTRCTLESVYSITFADGMVFCSDFEEKER